MTTEEFLRAIWPTTGPYALAIPNVAPAKGWRHVVCDSVESAAVHATNMKPFKDVYFCVHSLLDVKRWNPTKIDYKTRQPGAWEVRSHANMRAARALFFDLDIGEKATKYQTQQAAIVDLIRFCKETQLPKPLVVSSGNGLHIYWTFTDELISSAWIVVANKLHQLAKYHGLRVDPSRTTDTSSVLRVVGTCNRKNPDRPGLVEVLAEGFVSETNKLIESIDAALVRADIAPHVTPIVNGLGINTDVIYSGPPITYETLLNACAQIRYLADHPVEQSNSSWYAALGVIKFTNDGESHAHEFSSGYPGYSKDETDAKLSQLSQKTTGATLCSTLSTHCSTDLCASCQFRDAGRSPIFAASHFFEPLPAPVVTELVGTVVVETQIPKSPGGYERNKDGIYRLIGGKSDDGDPQDKMVRMSEYDMYPVRRLVNKSRKTENHDWCVTMPRTGPAVFTFDADMMHDQRKFSTVMSNTGIFIDFGCSQHVQGYMVAYIRELQKAVDAEVQNNHLGWSDDYKQFILPDKILLTDGTMKRSTLHPGAERSSVEVHKKGSLERQIELLKFYNDPAYVVNQFYILGSLAAPIYYGTGQHGVIINASGEAGSSKSTTLYTAASMWGQPELFPINGTNNGATVRARNERVSVLANLPICVDEITHMPIKDAIDLAMSITQPGHRLRLEHDGKERAATGSYKATIMLATANNSLHGMLSTDNAAGTAGSMRVFEIIFRPTKVHQKFEADNYLHHLTENYGHIGEVFMTHVLQHQKAVVARIREVMKDVDAIAKIKGSERFWSAAVASILVAGEIANQLGLLSFDMAAIRDWVLGTQVPSMRGVVEIEYASPISVLADYLESINGDIIIMSHHSNANISNVLRAPRGPMKAHYNISDRNMWVLREDFKQYCVQIGANASRIIDTLHIPTILKDKTLKRIVTNPRVRKVLGAGSEFAKAQSYCFIVDMSHPEICGTVDTSGMQPKSNVRKFSVV